MAGNNTGDPITDARQKLQTLRRLCEASGQPFYVEILDEIIPVFARALDGQPNREVAAMQWQPIETAPTDGTSILAIVAGEHPDSGEPYVPEVVHWLAGWWNESWSYDAGVDYQPTHWMPLPDGPLSPKEPNNGN